MLLRAQLRSAGLHGRQLKVPLRQGVLRARGGVFVLPAAVPAWVTERPNHYERAWLDAWAITTRARSHRAEVIVSGAAAAVLQGCFGDWRGRWEGGRDLAGDWAAAHRATRPLGYVVGQRNLRLAGCRLLRAAFDGTVEHVNGLCLADRTTALIDALGLAQITTSVPWRGRRVRRPSALLDLFLQRKWLEPPSVIERCESRRATGRRGRRATARLKWAAHRAAEGTHSHAEREFAQLLRREGFRRGGKRGWQGNYEVTGTDPIGGGHWSHRFDVAWPSHRLAVEVDGRSYHMGDEAFERDRRVLGLATAQGWRVVHVTWRQITEEAPRVVSMLREALGRCLK